MSSLHAAFRIGEPNEGSVPDAKMAEYPARPSKHSPAYHRARDGHDRELDQFRPHWIETTAGRLNRQIALRA